jgi:hypothetical protein
MKRILGLILVLVAGFGTARAQTSASYHLTEAVVNAGGDPRDGSFASSAGNRIRLDAIGQGAIGSGLSSASYHMNAGFVGDYPPPLEVMNVRWSTTATLVWDPEKSVGRYEIYRDLISTLPGGFGACYQSGLVGESWTESSSPPVGAGWFYFVTARNLLAEEGSKGFRSSGVERTNPSPCP